MSRVACIDGVRAVGQLWTFAFHMSILASLHMHFSSPLYQQYQTFVRDSWWQQGHLATDILFMLSGFTMMLTKRPISSSSSSSSSAAAADHPRAAGLETASAILKRFMRLYVPYLPIVFASYASVPECRNIVHRYVFLTQSMGYPMSEHLCGGHLWSIPLEFFFSAALLICMHVFGNVLHMRMNVKRWMIVLAAVCLPSIIVEWNQYAAMQPPLPVFSIQSMLDPARWPATLDEIGLVYEPHAMEVNSVERMKAFLSHYSWWVCRVPAFVLGAFFAWLTLRDQHHQHHLDHLQQQQLQDAMKAQHNPERRPSRHVVQHSVTSITSSVLDETEDESEDEVAATPSVAESSSQSSWKSLFSEAFAVNSLALAGMCVFAVLLTVNPITSKTLSSALKSHPHVWEVMFACTRMGMAFAYATLLYLGMSSRAHALLVAPFSWLVSGFHRLLSIQRPLVAVLSRIAYSFALVHMLTLTGLFVLLNPNMIFVDPWTQQFSPLRFYAVSMILFGVSFGASWLYYRTVEKVIAARLLALFFPPASRPASSSSSSSTATTATTTATSSSSALLSSMSTVSMEKRLSSENLNARPYPNLTQNLAGMMTTPNQNSNPPPPSQPQSQSQSQQQQPQGSSYSDWSTARRRRVVA
jgi:peptidoglycan/LPS O-acetylase OafA/YrhL